MNPKGFIDILNYVKRYVGIPTILLILSSLFLLLFAKLLDDLDSIIDATIIAAFALLAILVLLAGLFNGFTHFVNKRYGLKIGKGFLDGLLAGFISGMAGGLIYGLQLDSANGNDSFSFRMLRGAIVSTPIGGFYGLVLALFKPKQRFFWRERLAACLVLSIVIIILVISIAIWYGDNFKGVHDLVECFIIMIIIGFYILIMAGVEIAHQMESPNKLKILVRLLFLLVHLLIFCGIFIGLDFLFFDKPLLEFKFSEKNQYKGILVGLLLLVWSASGYFLATRDNRLTNKLDGFFGLKK